MGLRVFGSGDPAGKGGVVVELVTEVLGDGTCKRDVRAGCKNVAGLSGRERGKPLPDRICVGDDVGDKFRLGFGGVMSCEEAAELRAVVLFRIQRGIVHVSNPFRG